MTIVEFLVTNRNAILAIIVAGACLLSLVVEAITGEHIYD